MMVDPATSQRGFHYVSRKKGELTSVQDSNFDSTQPLGHPLLQKQAFSYPDPDPYRSMSFRPHNSMVEPCIEQFRSGAQAILVDYGIESPVRSNSSIVKATSLVSGE
jgi:hypothetical protein